MLNSRRKGGAGEREFCEECVKSLGIPVKRKLGAARDGGDDVELGPFSVEVKRCEALRIEEWWDQATDNAKGKIPILAYRRSRRGWKVVMDLQTFFKLAREEIVGPVEAMRQEGYLPAKPKIKHVCGLQGFGMSPDDYCPACRGES